MAQGQSRTEEHEPETSANVRARYRARLRTLGTPGGGALEDGNRAGEVDLSAPGIAARLELVKEQLYQVIAQHLGSSSALYELADRIVQQGDLALRLLGADDERLNHNPSLLGDLEAIIRTDGSRPSFLIRDGRVDCSTSPAGDWAERLQVSGEFLAKAIACVGRVDVGRRHVGTGFLVHERLMLTNRHVLNQIATRDAADDWQFAPNTVIDFGREFRARASLDVRAPRSVVFCGSEIVDEDLVDHTKLDVALIELEPLARDAPPVRALAVEAAEDPPGASTLLYTLGYAGWPRPGENAPSLLDQLFQSTFGCKRLAPGAVVHPQDTIPRWSFSHDATTLGGNSGSLLVRLGTEANAIGIHYAGRSGQPAENWAHALGAALRPTAPLAEVRDRRSQQTLKECMQTYEVALIGCER